MNILLLLAGLNMSPCAEIIKSPARNHGIAMKQAIIWAQCENKREFEKLMKEVKNAANDKNKN